MHHNACLRAAGSDKSRLSPHASRLSTHQHLTALNNAFLLSQLCSLMSAEDSEKFSAVAATLLRTQREKRSSGRRQVDGAEASGRLGAVASGQLSSERGEQLTRLCRSLLVVDGLHLEFKGLSQPVTRRRAVLELQM